jgi:hypothetical protein
MAVLLTSCTDSTVKSIKTAIIFGLFVMKGTVPKLIHFYTDLSTSKVQFRKNE